MYKKNHHMKYSFVQYMISFGKLSNFWLQRKIILPQAATKNHLSGELKYIYVIYIAGKNGKYNII
jgi:hypothetical protein